MTTLNSQISILILNLNGLSAPIKDTGKLNKKSKPIGSLYSDPSHKQGHTDSKQTIGGRLTNQMESKKPKKQKKQVL